MIGISVIVGALVTNPKNFVKKMEELEIRYSVEHITAEIGENTSKSPGILRGLVVI